MRHRTSRSPYKNPARYHPRRCRSGSCTPVNQPASRSGGFCLRCYRLKKSEHREGIASRPRLSSSRGRSVHSFAWVLRIASRCTVCPEFSAGGKWVGAHKIRGHSRRCEAASDSHSRTRRASSCAKSTHNDTTFDCCLSDRHRRASARRARPRLRASARACTASTANQVGAGRPMRCALSRRVDQ